MQITIRGHHLTVTPAIEEDIRLKFAQMTKHLEQQNSFIKHERRIIMKNIKIIYKDTLIQK